MKRLSTAVVFIFCWFVWLTIEAPAAQRGQISPGETRVDLQISAPDYNDIWTFTGQTGDRLLISAETTSGDLTPGIKLYPPDGGSCEAQALEIIDHQLQQSGLYTIVVHDHLYNDEGTYNITLLDLPDGPLTSTDDPNGGPIESGETLSGGIIASDMDAFQFHGEPNDRVLVSAKMTSGTLTPSIKLYPPDGGACVAQALEIIDHQLQQSGLYTIVVHDHLYDDEGTYNITLLDLQSFDSGDFEPDGDIDVYDLAFFVSDWLRTDCSNVNSWCDTTDIDQDNTVNFEDFSSLACNWLQAAITSVNDSDGGPMESGQTLAGDVTISDMDAFQFYGEPNDRVLVIAKTTAGTLTPNIKLYPPDGGSCEAQALEIIDHQLQQSGLYTIVVHDHLYNDEGTYNITLLDLPDGPLTSSNDPDGGSIACGQTLSGAIVVSDMDAFQFNGNAGERVIVDVETTSGLLTGGIKLYPPDGGDCEAQALETIDHQLLQSGLYTIVVHDHLYNDEGTYDIILTCP